MGNDLPLIRNNGRYGELGHWGKRSGKRFTKKKILLLGTLLSLSLIFAISHNQNLIPIVNAGDYNTSYSHTRTNIFNDQNFNGIANSFGSLQCCNNTYTVTVSTTVNNPSLFGVCILASFSGTLSSMTFYASKGPSSPTGTLSAQLYSFTGSIP